MIHEEQKCVYTFGYRPQKIPKKLPGTIWGITVYFNPSKSKLRHENFRRSIASIRLQGLKILCVELTFNDIPFEFEQTITDKMIRMRGDDRHMMWQKEALLNIALKNLPLECDKVVWFDADIIFDNKNWVSDTAKLLEEYVAIQPFSHLIRLPKYKGQFNFNDLNENITDLQRFPEPFGPRLYSTGRAISENGTHSLKENYLSHGLTGYAWAARRDFLDDISFYDKLILGNGDTVIAHALFGSFNTDEHPYFSEALIKDKLNWTRRVFAHTQGSVYFTKGNLYHLWHGTRKNRNFDKRRKAWKKFDFNPQLDIAKEPSGLWCWSSQKPELRYWIRDYFTARDEDSDEG